MNAPFVDLVAAWLGTFALHSTLVLAGAFALSRAFGARAFGAQEHALRFAPWLALVSASLQCAVFGSPWSLPVVGAHAPALGLDDVAAPAMFELVAGEPPPATAFLASWRWQQLVVGSAALAALGGMFWLVSVAVRLRRLLADRLPEADPRVLSLAATAAEAAGLRQSPHVSRSTRVVTPIAFGLLRPEICLPANAASLDAPSLRAMLAHEIAHLRAADPAWMWGAAWLQALFPWQLLLFPVRARWSRLVELRCDAEAARHAGSTAVARCLLDVASWLQPKTQAPLVALGMASRPSALRERVDAALRGEPFAPPSHRRAFAGASAVLGALTFAAPGAVPAADAESLAAVEPAAIEHALTTPSSPSTVALLDLLTRERAQLRAEAQQLLRSGPSASLETRRLQAALAERLRGLDRLHARLSAHVGRTHRETR